MIKQRRKASYVTRVTCRMLEKPTAFLRDGEQEGTNIYHRAEMFALIWNEVKDIRDRIHDGSLSRKKEAKSLKFRKKALLALVQGAERFEVDKILDGANLFDGVKFLPQAQAA